MYSLESDSMVLNLHHTSVIFVSKSGHVTSKDGIGAYHEKIEKVKKWPTPTNEVTFVLQTDACGERKGAVLCQEQEG